MTAEWRFEPKRRSQKSRDPMQASFFSNASIDDDTHALVREAIQNSLDAKAAPDTSAPVKVRFFIGYRPAGDESMHRYLPPSAWDHFNADDNGLANPPTPSDDCRFLVYEDFNTHGLVGDEYDAEPRNKNSFYYFMRAEGQSGKEEGDRGRHGIGKYVFPYTSRIRMFIAATVRSTDKKCLVAGQCVLKSHHVNAQQYTPDGWWGVYKQENNDDYFQLPVDDNTGSLLKQLRKDFGLTRKKSDTGLSIIMPYIQDEVTSEKLAEHVIREYFWPILKNQLCVEVVEDKNTKIINAESIYHNLSELLPLEVAQRIMPFISLAARTLPSNDCPVIELKLPTSPSQPKWNKQYLDKETATIILKAISREESCACIRCPLHVQRINQNITSTSYFDIFLTKDISDTSQKPLFVREGITIPEDRVPSVRGYISIVSIEQGSLATLLGDSENPAHTEWEKNAPKFKGIYRWGHSTIDFVRLSVSKLLKLLSQGDEELDTSILSDIFYLETSESDEDVPIARKRRKQPKPGSEDEPVSPIPPARPKTYRLSKTDDGFVITGPSTPLNSPRLYKVRVAYDLFSASKEKALKRHHKNDFDLCNGTHVNKPIIKNLKVLKTDKNTIIFLVNKNDFKLEITGFDKHRDIIVDVKSEAVSDEAI